VNPDGRSLGNQMRLHADRLAPGLYRTLMFALAEDCDAGGIVAEICRDFAGASDGAVVQLRLLAGVQRLVLNRQAPELAVFYPNLGGTADPAAAWPVFRQVLVRHADQLRDELAIAPQTNEPGRSVPLLVGIFDAVSRSGLDQVRLLEPGASAGLNLLVDRFLIGGDGWSSGPADSPVRLLAAVEGPVRPVDYRIVTRRGCDLAPVDASTPEGRLRLTSFVWPHDLHRHERLRAALAVAARYPVPVDAAPASSWLTAQLASPATDGVLTVVWHSVTRQYWPASEVTAVDEAIAEARHRMPIAHIAMESWSPDDPQPTVLTVRLSVPGGLTDPEPRELATVADHGVPVRLI
jgi:hypothetical protein